MKPPDHAMKLMRGCLEAVLEFRREVKAPVVCLCGNHEDSLLRTLRDHRRHSWLLGMEAFDTIRSYSVEAAATPYDAASRAGANLGRGHAVTRWPTVSECTVRIVPTRRLASACSRRA